MADGGEGTIKVLKYYLQDSKIIKTKVKGPLNREINAKMLYNPKCNEIYIEMAEAAGYMRLSKLELNPLYTSTYGVGQLMRRALDYKPKRIIIGLGGSCTNDGGMGFLNALRVDFYDKNKKIIPLGGMNLKDISEVVFNNFDSKFNKIELIVLTDVKNPLLGSNGATYTFGEQKGGDEATLRKLELGMENYASVIEDKIKKNIRDLEGVGAAGGLGFALQLFPNVKVIQGTNYIASIANIEKNIKLADMVFVGEGSMDTQSMQGKAPIGIATIAKKYQKHVIAIVGLL